MLSSVLRAIGAIPAVVLPGLVALPAGCAASPPTPVAIVTLGIDRTNVPFGESTEATIQFDVSPTLEPLGEDYRVFLHVLDESGSLLWTDDHDPRVPTSAWRPGRSIQYTRRIGIAAHPYIGPAAIAIGLYSPVSGARLALTGEDLGDFAYRAATLVIEPPHERSILVYESGWHGIEFQRASQTTWRWTTGRAVLSFRNPYRGVRLRLDAQGSRHRFERPQRLSVVRGDRTIHTTTLDMRRPVLLDYELTTVDLGGDDVVRLELLIDQTTKLSVRDNGAADTRELGIRVFEAHVELLPE